MHPEKWEPVFGIAGRYAALASAATRSQVVATKLSRTFMR
jgi:hypothetical protein